MVVVVVVVAPTPTPTLTLTLTLKGGEAMKRLLAFVVAIVGLGMMLSGCTFVGTEVKDAYVQKNYIDKVKVPKSKVVGDRNIKFYVGKVVDKRKYKYAMRKPIYGLDIAAKVRLKNPTLTIRNVTEKALYNTGWGVVDNKSKADFVINTTLETMHLFQRLIDMRYRTKANLCILNKDGKILITKHIHAEHSALMVASLTMQFKYVVCNLVKDYYNALINYFSSPEFVKAIKKAYKEENDDSTKSQ